MPNFSELCSTQFLDVKCIVPCDIEMRLNKIYGNEVWRSTNSKNSLKSVNLVYRNDWSDDDWLKVVKFYDNYGKLKINDTLTYLNFYSNLTIKFDQN